MSRLRKWKVRVFEGTSVLVLRFPSVSVEAVEQESVHWGSQHLDWVINLETSKRCLFSSDIHLFSLMIKFSFGARIILVMTWAPLLFWSFSLWGVCKILFSLVIFSSFSFILIQCFMALNFILLIFAIFLSYHWFICFECSLFLGLFSYFLKKHLIFNLFFLNSQYLICGFLPLSLTPTTSTVSETLPPRVDYWEKGLTLHIFHRGGNSFDFPPLFPHQLPIVALTFLG